MVPCAAGRPFTWRKPCGVWMAPPFGCRHARKIGPAQHGSSKQVLPTFRVFCGWPGTRARNASCGTSSVRSQVLIPASVLEPPCLLFFVGFLPLPGCCLNWCEAQAASVAPHVPPVPAGLCECKVRVLLCRRGQRWQILPAVPWTTPFEGGPKSAGTLPIGRVTPLGPTHWRERPQAQARRVKHMSLERGGC